MLFFTETMQSGLLMCSYHKVSGNSEADIMMLIIYHTMQ